MKKEIKLTPKKPKLAYLGMEKVTPVEAVPTQVIEVVYPSRAEKAEENTLFSRGELQPQIQKSDSLPNNRLIWTNDNLVALKTLLDERDPVSGEYRYRGNIDLIYIDPPFMVQSDFVAENSIDIEIDKKQDILATKEPTIIETLAYKDTWQNGLDSFLQMMRERLLVMKDLLSNKGSIYIHLDWHASHYVKVLMDEIFGYENFVNEIIWAYEDIGSRTPKNFKRKHDVILLYQKTAGRYFNPLRKMLSESTIKRFQKYFNDKGQISYQRLKETNPGVFKKLKGIPDDLSEIWLDVNEGPAMTDWWIDISPLKSGFAEHVNFPTQKPVKLLKKIIKSSCPTNGIVLDAFVGSGTTCIAAEQLSDELDCTWIGVESSKFGIHLARKRLIELSEKLKDDKKDGLYKVQPFTVENIGYYQREAKWDSIQISKQADAYRQAIVQLFGGEYTAYSRLLHGKKRGAWIHVGPLSKPITPEQINAIAEEVKETELSKCYVLSADFTAKYDREQIKKKLGVDIMVRVIPASAIDEVKKRLRYLVEHSHNKESFTEPSHIVFFAPLTISAKKSVSDKEVLIELTSCEIDTDSFLDSQKAERRSELEKWLKNKKSWQSFVDFWAIDWDYNDRRDTLEEEIFENEWQSFRKRKGNKVLEDIVFKAFHTYEKPGEYTIAIKITDIFGNDGITTLKAVIK